MYLMWLKIVKLQMSYDKLREPTISPKSQRLWCKQNSFTGPAIREKAIPGTLVKFAVPRRVKPGIILRADLLVWGSCS